MQTLTLGFKDSATEEKILWFLNHFKDDGVEVLSKGDLSDLRAVIATRNDEKISLEDYLKNESYL